MKREQLTFIARAIKALDQVKWFAPRLSDDDLRISSARVYLINIIFDNGYELQQDTYRVIKSKYKRRLIETPTI